MEQGQVAYDYIVVGGGTAGCVLAARLSADASVRVLLIEAGRDMAPGEEPKAIRDPFPAPYGDPQFSWPNLTVEVGPDLGDGRPVATRQFVQGRVIGGSSTINGMMAMRGLPSDFDEWERLGAEGWGWQGVLPYFRRLENDWDSDGPFHGNTGPVPIRRTPRASWPPLAAAVAEELEVEGYPFHPDFNGFFDDCVTAVPMNNTPVARVSTAMAYLTAEVRRRPNLVILAEATAERLALEEGRVTGVIVRKEGATVLYRAHEVLVAAGALMSPALLMRSGIGPAAALRRAGVEPVVDRPGVGQNLFNHVIAHLAVHLRRRAKQRRDLTSWAFSILRYSSNHPGCPPGDMQLSPTNRTAWHPLGWRIGALGVCLCKPFSTGSVEIRSADPADPPVVRHRLLSDPRDFARMVDGLGRAVKVLQSARVRALINEVFVPPPAETAALNRPGWRNWLRSGTISLLFDLPFGLRRAALKRHALDLSRLGADESARADLVRRISTAVHHVSGTCRIGRADDPTAVLDPRCRVYGVEGLRVIDASVMPTLISANTHLAIIMIGEKAAQMILDERSAAGPESSSVLAGAAGT